MEVNQQTKKIAVRIDGSDRGSGVIVSRQDDNYLVLTNWHVVQSPGDYTIQTFDGQSHSVVKKQQLLGADLAVVYFNSSDRYSVAQRGDSQDLVEGQNIYFAGYPALVGSPTYRFYAGNLIGFLSPPNRDGYELIYSGEAISGMSGSPLFDENATLIGIYGQTELEPRTGSPSLYGIPIDTAEKLSRRMGIDLAESVAISALPTTKPQPASNVTPSSTESPTPVAFVGIPRLIDSTTTQKAVEVQSTYYFTIAVPDHARTALKKIQFSQTSGSEFLGKNIRQTTGFEGTRKNRGTEFSVALVENDRDSRNILVDLDRPVLPGKTITIALRTKTPQISGVYQLRVTGFPDGDNVRDASLGVARFHFYSHR